MILYPTTLLFRVVRALERALAGLKAGKQTPEKQGVRLTEYEQIVALPHWAEIESRFQRGQEQQA